MLEDTNALDAAQVLTTPLTIINQCKCYRFCGFALGGIDDVSNATRNPVFWVWGQVKLKPTCSAIEKS